MTRKDYFVLVDWAIQAGVTWDQLSLLCSDLKEDNSNFDKLRFRDEFLARGGKYNNEVRRS